MHRFPPCLALLLSLLAAAAPMPSTAPAIDLSTPRSAAVSFYRQVQVGDLKGMEKCVAPLSSTERDAMRSDIRNLVIACVLVNRFGAENLGKYANTAAG